MTGCNNVFHRKLNVSSFLFRNNHAANGQLDKVVWVFDRHVWSSVYYRTASQLTEVLQRKEALQLNDERRHKLEHLSSVSLTLQRTVLK